MDQEIHALNIASESDQITNRHDITDENSMGEG
jgi:hypothetical protein